MPALSARQIQIVKDTWEVPKKDLEGSGQAILFRYFEKYPHNQQKFAAFKNHQLDALKVGYRKLLLIDLSDLIKTPFRQHTIQTEKYSLHSS